MERNYTLDDFHRDDETSFAPWYTHQVNLVLKQRIEDGELTAADAEQFAWQLTATLRTVGSPIEIGILPESMARIPLIWGFDFVWASCADAIIRNNRDDQIAMPELTRISVAFATARQFNEALFIDIERSVIWKLKEDLKTNANYGTFFTKELANLMWAFAVSGEGSSELW